MKIASLFELEQVVQSGELPKWDDIDWEELVNGVKDLVYQLQSSSLKHRLHRLLDVLSIGVDQFSTRIAPLSAGVHLLLGLTYQKSGYLEDARVQLDLAWGISQTISRTDAREWLEAAILKSSAKVWIQQPWPISPSGVRSHMLLLARMTRKAVRANIVAHGREYDNVAQEWRAASLYRLAGLHSESVPLLGKHLEYARGGGPQRGDLVQMGNSALPQIYFDMATGGPSERIVELAHQAGRYYFQAGSYESALHLLFSVGLADVLGMERVQTRRLVRLFLAALSFGDLNYIPTAEGAAEALNIGRVLDPRLAQLVTWAVRTLPIWAEEQRRGPSRLTRLSHEQILRKWGYGTEISSAIEEALSVWSDITRGAGQGVRSDDPANSLGRTPRVFQPFAVVRKLFEVTVVQPELTFGSPTLKRKVIARMSTFVLHISDPQFGTANVFHRKSGTATFMDDPKSPHPEAHGVANMLLADVNERFKRDSISNIDFVVLSGDVANSGQKIWYEEALYFLRQLQQGIAEFNGIPFSKDRFIMVPGNHDVDWSVLKGANRRTRDGIWVARNGQEARYDSRFRHYREFWQEWYGRPYPIEQRFTVSEFPDHRITFFGLDSCELEDDKQHFGFVNPKRVREALKQRKNGYTNIVVIHHNLDPVNVSLRDPEVSLKATDYLRVGYDLVGMFDDSDVDLVLHGHTHISLAPYPSFTRKGKSTLVCGAGTVSVDRHQRPGKMSPLPLSYNVFEISRARPGGSIKFFRREGREDEDSGSHYFSGVPGDDGKRYTEIPLLSPSRVETGM